MFLYKDWDAFCKSLNEKKIFSYSANEVRVQKKDKFLILKHDVETNPQKALELAKIEAKYGHKGVYYVQAYLLNKKNISTLKKIKDLGHEISYHYDVMDSCKGDIEKATLMFDNNLNLFLDNGFKVNTVCQHGNPIVERVGYSSNRDFFRNMKIQKKYYNILDIMVNYKTKIGVDYKYISDAGYEWKVIFDPETNDIIKSDDKNIILGKLDNVLKFIENNDAVIVSTHPHRWYSYALTANIKDNIFGIVRKTAKIMVNIPILKKFMGKFYFLAKKI